jgi:crotonobetainyl-CoA:carnitine CoA-transferase CaiB-like acyl-CoA transferase
MTAESLRDARVLDFTHGIAGPYCSKLLADAGADVVVVEPETGAAERQLDPGLFAFLHTSKRSVGLETAQRLRAAADIVIADEAFDVAAARRMSPEQVIVTITPFGTSGPWVGRAATEFTLQAACGSLGGRGLPEDAPVAAGGRLGEWLAAVYAAVGAIAAWVEARRSGHGEHVDVAMLDCMAIGLVTFPSVFA